MVNQQKEINPLINMFQEESQICKLLFYYSI